MRTPNKRRLAELERFEEAKADEADDLLDDLEFNPSDAAPRVGHLSGRYDMILYDKIHEFSCVASWVARALARGSLSHGENGDFSTRKKKGVQLCVVCCCVLLVSGSLKSKINYPVSVHSGT